MTNLSLFWTVIIAGSGGLLVLAGLLMEQLAEKKIFKNVARFRRSKRIKLGGELVLIAGVLVEVILAGYTAVGEWQNDPLKKPLASASARARFIVKIKSNSAPLFVKPEQTQFGWQAGISFFSAKSSNTILGLTSENCSMWRMGTTNELECRMEFHEDSLDFLQDQSKRTKTLVKQFEDVNSFVLHMPDMETNAEVISGTVILNVNDFTWTFDVPRQVSNWGLITMENVKDKSGQIAAQVRRMQLIDFVFPPRFTNIWYDGK